jgi:potassium inwardly-rectifying channel subfamily J
MPTSDWCRMNVLDYSDIFTTMIDVKWRWIFLTFTLVFLTSWSTFAIIYFTLSYVHGDINLMASDIAVNKSSVWEPCVSEVTSLYSAFLYSVETQHTIGYGTRYGLDHLQSARGKPIGFPKYHTYDSTMFCVA